MEDTRVTFETAKLAKEKGFKKVKCNYYYDKSGNPQKEVGIDNLHRDGQFNKVVAPTQSLLSKWLREEHNFHISINVGLPHKAHIMYYSNVIKFGKEHKSKYKSVFYNTYEEALEVGLQEALKLI